STGTFVQPNPGDARFDAARPKFYCLDMFPYPSGSGLHVGHPEGYTATDIICRYKRMKGFNVLHPMGWDAFGLPAEQYAIQTGIHPAITTRTAIDNFRRQLKRFGFSYDWSREFGTIDPGYYKWTQWIFLKLYDAWFDGTVKKARPISELVEREKALGASRPGGAWPLLTDTQRREFIDARRLAYIGEQTVNWCPKLGTVLANDEVIDGKSERGSFPVLRKPLRQWMFRITAYADRLLDQLQSLDWPSSTKAMQSEWIGRSEGAEIDFAIGRMKDRSLRVFTTRPDTLFGATYMVIAPEHPLVEELLARQTDPAIASSVRAYVAKAKNLSDIERMENKKKTGVFSGLSAVNPANGEQIPIWIADYVLMGYGTGAIMAVPAHDQRDHEFATTFNLPIQEVVSGGKDCQREAFTGAGVAVNSSNAEVSLDTLDTDAAKARMTAWLSSKGLGSPRVNYKFRDWTFSRQRYWGEPFPIVYTADGSPYPVSPSALPVTLPELADYAPIESDDPLPLLAKATQWVNTTAGQAGVDPSLLPPQTPVRRETNTMPGSAGSSWYAVRYCDTNNAAEFVSKAADTYWMAGTGGDASKGGVDLYLGGSEHAVGHLLYSRFWHNVLHDLGYLSTAEPFHKLFHQGLITSFSYQRPDKSLVPSDMVEEVTEGQFIEKATGVKLTPVTAKMSKSLKNVVNPDDVIAEFGADTFRLYEMYMGPLEASKPWNPRDITGLFRFLSRVWRLAIDEKTGAL
ncbi:MAG: leucine--tRNA ligase, partial [Planctomycetota bacterium]